MGFEPSPPRPEGRCVSVAEAARHLGLPAEQMLAWNMVVVIRDARGDRVPRWCLDPAVARVMPLLSDHFRGVALDYCLRHMRPRGDGRSGIDLLGAGDWLVVRDTLRSHRRRFDQILRHCETCDWLAALATGNGAARAPSVPERSVRQTGGSGPSGSCPP